jgi:hypothetical protein
MATVNLTLLFALTAFSSSSIAGPMMVLIIGDRNAVVGRKLPLGVLQTFLDLVNLMGSEVPVVHFAGEPQLGVAKLCRGRRAPVRKAPSPIARRRTTLRQRGKWWWR